MILVLTRCNVTPFSTIKQQNSCFLSFVGVSRINVPHLHLCALIDMDKLKRKRKSETSTCIHTCSHVTISPGMTVSYSSSCLLFKVHIFFLIPFFFFLSYRSLPFNQPASGMIDCTRLTGCDPACMSKKVHVWKAQEYPKCDEKMPSGHGVMEREIEDRCCHFVSASSNELPLNAARGSVRLASVTMAIVSTFFFFIPCFLLLSHQSSLFSASHIHSQKKSIYAYNKERLHQRCTTGA